MRLLRGQKYKVTRGERETEDQGEKEKSGSKRGKEEQAERLTEPTG